MFDYCRECWELAASDVIVSAERRRVDDTQLYSVIHCLRSVCLSHSLSVCLCSCGILFRSWWLELHWKQLFLILSNKKHLKNVGPIRYCEPPLYCQSPGVASRTPAIAIAQAACDVHDIDNAWQRGPLWPHGMGPISRNSELCAGFTRT